MLTAAARRARDVALADPVGVLHRSQLAQMGWDAHGIDAQVAAGRWRRRGPAVVLHNGPLTRAQCHRVALINCGPRAVLTSFTALEASGLKGWTRNEIHVLAPAGTADPGLAGLILHRTGDWAAVDSVGSRRLHAVAPAALLAAASFSTSRPACGLLAACVQQRLTRPPALLAALERASRTRHRSALLHAVQDIAQGAEALSEIDLRRLCRKHGLPLPTHQAVRVEPNGRRRYLDAQWQLPDGRILAVEVDGAYHLAPEQWISDQLRQNQVVIGGTVVLRFPSIVVRDRPELVAAQLRALLLVAGS